MCILIRLVFSPVLGPIDSQFSHPCPQGVRVDLQEARRCPRRPSMRPCVIGQNAFDVLLHRRIERQDLRRSREELAAAAGVAASGRRPLACAQGLGHVQTLAVAQDRRSIDDRSQLSDISGPRIRCQQLNVFGRQGGFGQTRTARRPARQNAGPWRGCPQAARGAEAGGWEIRRCGTRGPRGTALRPPSPPGRDGWPPRCGR